MKALRIILTQSKAHYRKEESLENKMTYPLPPFSTVIGALHQACGFKEYQEMNLSIQGDYQSLSKQAYTDYCFLDSVMDDRGMLVKMKNSNLYSSSFDKVASAMKSQGNSFKNNVTINIHDQKLMEEYWALKRLEIEIQKFKDQRLKKVNDLIKKRKKTLSQKKKATDKKSELFGKLSKREKEIKIIEKTIKEKFESFRLEHYLKPISKYKSLTTSLKYYEILQEVKLIIHIESTEETLNCIKDNVYNIKSIGRSEDYVDVKECEFVELTSNEGLKTSEYSAFLNYELVKEKQIFLKTNRDDIKASGTVYWINKVYNKEKGFRDFEKVKVAFASNYMIKSKSKDVFYDGDYIVNFS